MAGMLATSTGGFPDVQALEKLSPTVFRCLGLDPGPYTLMGTNTYLVGTGKARILIDTGSGRPEYIDNLRQAMAQAGAESLSQIIITHAHGDHIGGIESILETFGETTPVRKLITEASSTVTQSAEGDEDSSSGRFTNYIPLQDGDIICAEGASLRVLYTPGHRHDHISLVFEEEKSMFTGDNVLGVGYSVFEHLGDYMRSLQLMQREIDRLGITTLYPGHGPHLSDASSVLQQYQTHRLERIKQVTAVLDSLKLNEAISSYEITRKIYTDTPEVLIPAAEGNVLHVLVKLEQDGYAVRADDLWSLKSKKEDSKL